MWYCITMYLQHPTILSTQKRLLRLLFLKRRLVTACFQIDTRPLSPGKPWNLGGNVGKTWRMGSQDVGLWDQFHMTLHGLQMGGDPITTSFWSIGLKSPSPRGVQNQAHLFKSSKKKWLKICAAHWSPGRTFFKIMCCSNKWELHS